MNRIFPVVYLEGERVPIQSVDIRSDAGNLLTMSIALFPSKYKIQPNTIVHVGYYTSDDPTIYLLGEGVVIGTSAVRSKTGNNADILMVSDYISLLNNVPAIFTPLEDKFFKSVWTSALTDFQGVSDLNTYASSLLDIFTQSGRDINKSVKKIISGAIGNIHNSSYLAVSQPFDLAARIHSVKTASGVQSLLQGQAFMSFLQSAFGQSNYTLTLLSLLTSFLQAVNYQLISLPAPSLIPIKGGKAEIRQYVVAPQVLYGPIPACNWIFPSFFTDFSYQVNYNTLPTRIVAPLTFLDLIQQNPKETENQSSTPSSTGTDKDAKPTKIAKLHASIGPAELRNLVGSNSIQYLTNPKCLTDEEKIRGIRVQMQPLDTYLGFVSAVDKKNNKPITNGNIIASYTDYFFYVARLSAVSANISVLPFNPYMVPGLPGGVFMLNEGFIGGGPIGTVIHTLRSTGEATTTVLFSGFAPAMEYIQTDRYTFTLKTQTDITSVVHSPSRDSTYPSGSKLTTKDLVAAGEGSCLDVNVYQQGFGVSGYSPYNPNMLAFLNQPIDTIFKMLKASRKIATLLNILGFENIPTPANILTSFYSPDVSNTVNGVSFKLFNSTRHDAVMAYKNDVTSPNVKGIF
jgi:hypothetical protein